MWDLITTVGTTSIAITFCSSTCCQCWKAKQKTLPCKICLCALWYLHYKLHNCHVACSQNLRHCNVSRDFQVHLSFTSLHNPEPISNLHCVSSSMITRCACDEELMRFLGFFWFLLFGQILLWTYNWQLQVFYTQGYNSSGGIDFACCLYLDLSLWDDLNHSNDVFHFTF